MNSWIPFESAWECSYGLPFGYEAAFDSRGFVYFIKFFLIIYSHVKKTTTNELPYERLFSSLRKKKFTNVEKMSETYEEIVFLIIISDY